MANAEKDSWVTHVLGVNLAQIGTPAEARSFPAAVRAWRAASDEVDAQISALQTALRATDDDELHEIGEYGLNAMTAGFKVPLLAALLGAENGAASDRAKLAEIIPKFRRHIDSDERIEACDENPFSVTVSIRATLIPALDQLQRSLGS
jgi:hypothetical protein